MPTLFPEDYEKASIGKKRILAKRLKDIEGFTGLDIALHAHEIYDYLKQQGVENPNGTFVEAFQYASTALGVPYEVIDDAFWTQIPVTEESLFDVSITFNPKAVITPEKDLPVIPITINFYEIVLSFFENTPILFWQQFRKEGAGLSQEDVQSYDLESLLQALTQEIWLKTKSGLEDQKETTIEHAKQMFLAYFYSNDQKRYRKETQEMLLACLQESLSKESTLDFKIDEALKKLLEKAAPNEIVSYVLDHLDHWAMKENYERFLRSITKTKNLSLMNQLLLLYQRSEASETKEVHDWIHENRTLKEEAEPIFLFGKNAHRIDASTGEIIQNKRLALMNHEELPIIPYFEKIDTEGRETVKKIEMDLKQLFVAIDKISKLEIVFEQLEHSTVADHKIRLKTGQSDAQTLQDLLICIVEEERKTQDSFIRFENQSVAYVLSVVFGLETPPLDFECLDNIRSLDNNKMKIQTLLTQVIFRSESFLEKLEDALNEKEPEKIRPTFEEEIKRARELQGQAMANVATDKENKANKKAEGPPSISDMLEKSKEKSEGDSDDRSDQESAD
ncbi:hypothetical protein [uncultured Enterococcus sp.]|uniref:hypothetical protein n=1 Tax=uncultured Enterococcus sp. TaxID=167972 RepID=UPI002AA60010|nr:hypothetical protein [uncultured Enterococcus sp.]